jgi:hypothetical protein
VKVLVSGDNKLAMEVKETGRDVAFGTLGGPGAPAFEDLLGHECNQVFEVWFAGEGLLDVTEDRDLWTGETVKHRNKSTRHLVLFCDFLSPVFIQRESASTSEVL